MGFSNINKPKRSLGQNFFVNKNLGNFLVEKTLENNPKEVVEIGGGRGFFTGLFLEKGVKVSTIEKDDTLSENLKFLFPNIEVFNEDIFSDKVKILFEKKDAACFGSLPYNVAKKIVMYVAENSTIESFYFVIQKEVAEKYVSKQKNSLLSIFTKLYFDSEIVCNISPENFKPRPNVTSSFIKFERNSNLSLVNDVKSFSKYLRTAFRQPRKKLRNNLKSYYSLEESSVLDQRAESLDLEKHLEVFKNLKRKAV